MTIPEMEVLLAKAGVEEVQLSRSRGKTTVRLTGRGVTVTVTSADLEDSIERAIAMFPERSYFHEREMGWR